ncbi:MAG: methyl-accepting chemotaxis protein, partial [Rhizobium rosettiformans]
LSARLAQFNLGSAPRQQTAPAPVARTFAAAQQSAARPAPAPAPAPANETTRAVASPARALASKIASAMGAKPAPSGAEWEEF